MKIILYPDPDKNLLEVLSLVRQICHDIRMTEDGLLGGTPPAASPEPVPEPIPSRAGNVLRFPQKCPIFLRPQAS